jgi:hypothetical protein
VQLRRQLACRLCQQRFHDVRGTTGGKHLRSLAVRPVQISFGEADRFAHRAAAWNRDAEIAVGAHAHHVTARALYPDEMQARGIGLRRRVEREAWLHGQLPRYFFIQPNTVSCHSLLLRAFNTQCPSSSKTSASAGTPRRRSAVNNCNP